MFCKNCGAEVSDKAYVCIKCGTKLINESNKSSDSEPETPVALIVFSWIILGVSCFNHLLGFALAIIMSFAVLLFSILLIANKNKTSKVNGTIILIIWIITFIIGFLSAL